MPFDKSVNSECMRSDNLLILYHNVSHCTICLRAIVLDNDEKVLEKVTLKGWW